MSLSSSRGLTAREVLPVALGRHRCRHELDQVLDRVGLTAVAVLTEVQKVTSLDLPVADAGLEDERVVAGVGCSDLTHVAEVLENPGDGCQDYPRGFAAVIRLEHNWVRKMTSSESRATAASTSRASMTRERDARSTSC